MLSNLISRTTLVNEEINMVWDGLFHAFCLFTTVVGLVMLWKAIKCKNAVLSGRILTGSSLLGWGSFNFVEGLIDHELFQIHHVYQNDPDRFFLWDGVFLAFGLVLILTGTWMIRSASGDNTVDLLPSVDEGQSQ